MTVPGTILDKAGLDAEMRAIAERAATDAEQRAAVPPVGLDPAEEAEDGAAQMDAAEVAADPLAVPTAVPPAPYHPVAPFGLAFTFDTQTGGYAGVTMNDATFWWNDAGTLTEKTASVGQLALSGTVYLNVTLDAQGKYASAAVGMSASGDLSLKLYLLDQNGVVKDYRHALVVLGVGGKVDLDGKSLDKVSEAAEGATPTGDEGKAEIKNWHAATETDNKSATKIAEDLVAASEATDLVPVRDANGNLKYKPIGILPLDNASLEVNASGSQRKMQIKGFSAANTGTIPIKNAQGVLTWDGKAITSISSSPSTEPGGTSTLTLTLSDGTTETLSAKNGTNGTNGQDGQDGVGVGSVTLKGTIGKTKTYSVMSDEATPTELGTFTVTDGTDGTSPTLDKEFQLDGVKKADIAASANINVVQKTLAAGQNITLTPSQDGKTITISAAGGSGGTSGFTGTRYTVANIRYDVSSHKMQMKRYTETWVDGVMTQSSLGGWGDIWEGAQAVQETV